MTYTYNEELDLETLVSGDAFIKVNKGLARLVGLVPATLYGELVSTKRYWKSKDKLTEINGTKDWFFCTIEDLENKTTVKKDTQNKAIKLLEKEGFLITKRFGLPSKRYFRITNKLSQMIIDNYYSQKPNTDDTNDLEEENTGEDQSNQISQKPNTTIRKNRTLDFAKTDTNKKELNNKQYNNSLPIDNYQEPKKIDEKILIETCNEFYLTFAIGRWDKKTWNKLIKNFVAETIENKRHETIAVDKVKGYVFKAIENMANHHDYKHSEEFKAYKETVSELNKTPIEIDGSGHFYNWLEERE